MRSLLSLAVGLVLCLLASCTTGPAPLKVTGKVVQNDKPYVAPKLISVGIVFIPIVEAGQPFDNYPTRMNDDSTFTVEGKAGAGIPAGKYRISIQQLAPDPAIIAMNEKFGEKNSPLIVDISGDKSLEIDLGKGTVK